MTFETLERIPRPELELRWKHCRTLLRDLTPQAGGLLVFSRMNIYYLSGTWSNGLIWLPLSGEPLLLVRKGLDRAKLESNCANILAYRSFRDLPGLAQEAEVPLSSTIAAEMSGLSWSLSQGLVSNLAEYAFTPGDLILHRARSVKTAWELAKMSITGQRHTLSLRELLPSRIVPGMTEREIAHRVWEVFFSQGHQGLMRMQNFGEEIFLGHVAAGDSGNYPSVFNGPLGLRGEHPAVPHMGSAGKVWQANEPLTLDVGFALEGYHTDKTQVYWSGPKSSLPDQVLRAHEFCMQVQGWLAENLVPGAIPSQLFNHCWQWADKQGWGDGFMALDGNKVRFLGHGIGLAVDEWPALAKGFDVPLEQGMVLALEPKLGIRGLGMVGVENTFEVTSAGGRCLTGEDHSIICLSQDSR
jgi:Xaa-Pro aminopeptidase